MLSRLFQYVANRNDFYNPWLTTQAPFDPVKADPKIDKLRTFLKLDKSNLNSDYFVTSVVAILISNHTIAHTLDINLDVQPELWKKIQTEKFRMFSLDWFLTNSKAGPATVNRLVNEWPVELEGSISKLNDDAARVIINGKSSDVSARFINSKTLHVEWPSWLGLTGTLTTENASAWDTGAKINFIIPPSNYPLSDVVKRLRYEPAFLDVLESRGYLAYYAGADASDAEKLAIVIYCLYLDTLDKVKAGR